MKLEAMKEMAGFENEGYCPCCESNVKFSASRAWYRDFYLCPNCGSCPRERALMYSIETFFPHWREAVIHESSPLDRGASHRIRLQAAHYIPSQYFPGVPSGQLHQGDRCENLEAMSFPDESIDLHITQDVFEHIFNPVAAFQEIARTLKPGGAHIFTVPLVNKERPTKICATIDAQGKVTHLVETPEYHGNPVDDAGSLVTWNWGYDIVQCIYQACGLHTEMIYLDALALGIRAEYIEVLIMRKPAALPALSAYYPLLQQHIDPLLSGQTIPSTDTILKAVESACRTDNPRAAFASLLTMADILIANGRAPIAQFVLDGAMRWANEWSDPYALQQIRVLEKKMNGSGSSDRRARPVVTISEANRPPAENRATDTLRLLQESGDLSKALAQYKSRLDGDLLALINSQAVTARAGDQANRAAGLEELGGKIQEAMQIAPALASGESDTVDIVIPVYGQAALVRRCVESVLDTVPSGKIILVDDCSPTREIEELFLIWKANPRVRMIHTPSNLGFLGASRLGASVGKAPFILFLNSDTEARELGWLERLIPAEQDVAVTGAKLLYPPDAPALLAGTIQHAGIARNRVGVPYHPFLGLPADTSEAERARDVNAVTGACFLVRRSVWQELGGWDAAYGRGVYEDVDFCWRARKLGYRIQYIPAASLYHRESASVAPNGQHTLNQHTEENRRTLLERWPAQSSDEAIFFGEKVLQRWEKARIMVQAAQPVLARGDFKNGLPSLQKAVALAPDWSEVLLANAQALAASGDPAHAVEFFRKALAVAPTLWDVRLRLADELVLLGEQMQARDELSILWRVFPANPQIKQRLDALPGGKDVQSFDVFPSPAPAPETAAETLEMLLAQDDLPAALKRYEDKLDAPLLTVVRQSAAEARQRNLSELADGLESLADYIAHVVANRPVGPGQISSVLKNRADAQPIKSAEEGKPVVGASPSTKGGGQASTKPISPGKRKRK